MTKLFMHRSNVLDRDEQSGQMGRYLDGDPKAGLAKSRWDAYRLMYSRMESTSVSKRDEAGGAFIMVDSAGLLSSGHTAGYLFRQQTQATTFRFQPCTLNRNEGFRQFDPEP